MAKPRIELIARALILDGSRVLLCRSVADGYYYLPGGHVEFGEQASSAVARELAEETGLAARVGECQMVHENIFETEGRVHHEINVVFHVELVVEEATIVRSRESAIDFEWMELAGISDADVRPLAAKAWLACGAGLASTWLSTVG
jgi:8-oxo-dGTP diphosphatase